MPNWSEASMNQGGMQSSYPRWETTDADSHREEKGELFQKHVKTHHNQWPSSYPTVPASLSCLLQGPVLLCQPRRCAQR